MRISSPLPRNSVTTEKATATLYWVKTDGNLENGASTNINQAKTRGIMATSHDGIVTLSGLHFLPFGVRTAPNHPYPHPAKHMMRIC